MGSFLNPISEGFKRSLRSPVFVDKSLLIRELNRLIQTEQRYVCVSRPRQFGKTMAVDMLAAYYGCGSDTRELFDALNIAGDPSFDKHLNRYDVIKVNMQLFSGPEPESALARLQAHLIDELREAHKNIRFKNRKSLPHVMMDVYASTGRPFVILIDEWDCILRENVSNPRAAKDCLDFLKAWLKDQDYVALAYMTGVMPVSRYETASALNMFADYPITHPGSLAEFFGFTAQESETLCREYGMSFHDMQQWYGGYQMVSYRRDGDAHYSMLHPKSVVEALLRHHLDTYWKREEEYIAHEHVIRANINGIKDDIEKMLAGEPVRLEIGVTLDSRRYLETKDEMLTLFVYLGYLTVDTAKGTVSIPNKEATRMFANINRKWSTIDPFIDGLLPDDPFISLPGSEEFL